MNNCLSIVQILKKKRKTNNKSFGLGLKYINEVHKCIYYILGDFVSSTDQIWVLNILQGMKICNDNVIKFSGIWNFPGYGRPGIKTYRYSCIYPGCENYPGYGNLPCAQLAVYV